MNIHASRCAFHCGNNGSGFDCAAFAFSKNVCFRSALLFAGVSFFSDQVKGGKSSGLSPFSSALCGICFSGIVSTFLLFPGSTRSLSCSDSLALVFCWVGASLDLSCLFVCGGRASRGEGWDLSLCGDSSLGVSLFDGDLEFVVAFCFCFSGDAVSPVGLARLVPSDFRFI